MSPLQADTQRFLGPVSAAVCRVLCPELCSTALLPARALWIHQGEERVRMNESDFSRESVRHP
jgi:hypothetical protein